MVRFKEYKKLIYKHCRFLYHFTVTLFTIHIDAHINLNPDTICNWGGGCQNASTSPTGAREAPREVAGPPAGDWRGARPPSRAALITLGDSLSRRGILKLNTEKIPNTYQKRNILIY